MGRKNSQVLIPEKEGFGNGLQALVSDDFGHLVFKKVLNIFFLFFIAIDISGCVLQSQVSLTKIDGDSVPNGLDSVGPLPPTALILDSAVISVNSSPLVSFTNSISTDVVAYQYSIGSTAGGTEVRGWTDGVSSPFSATGLSLTSSTNYYVNIRAVDSAGNFSTHVSTSAFKYLSVSATVSTVSGSPLSLISDGISTSIVTVTLLDPASNPVSGKTVAISSSRGATDTVSTISGTTNVLGQATFSVKSSTPGSSVITATNSTDNKTVSQTITLTFYAYVAPSSVNVAAATRGGIASSSSHYQTGNYIMSSFALNNGDRAGVGYPTMGWWEDNTPGVFPDWVQIEFDRSYYIGEVDLFTVQDIYNAPSVPNLSTSFTLYGLTGFEVQYWTGSTWTTITSVTANDKVWRQITFTPVYTSKIRVNCTTSIDVTSRIVELEAWTVASGGADATPPSVPTGLTVTGTNGAISWSAATDDNGVQGYLIFRDGTLVGQTGVTNFSEPFLANGVYSYTVAAYDYNYNESGRSDAVSLSKTTTSNIALASNGATAAAFSTVNASLVASNVINGNRFGIWGSGDGWNSITENVFNSEWVEVTFATSSTISQVDVITLQDNLGAPSNPTQAMTFSIYGITDYEVQYWTGSAWATIPYAVAANNFRVWRQFTFPAITTTKIRVWIYATRTTGSHYGRILEIEAWSN